MKKNFLIISGGTGGHVIPAENIANYILKKNQNCTLILDKRGYKYINNFKGKIHIVNSSNLSGNFISKIIGLINLIKGFIHSFFIILFLKPTTVISFGSYASFFPMLSIILLKPFYNIEIFIHEQNSILGRTNKLFLTFTKKLLLNFDISSKIKKKYKEKIHVVGSPHKNSKKFINKKIKDNNIFTISIFGGSQGSEFISNFSVNLIKLIESEKIITTQYIFQCPENIIKKVSSSLKNLSTKVIIKEYFNNIDEILNKTSVAISRAGAGFISDLIYYKVPSVLIPLPTSKDNHQFHNASIMHDHKVAVMISQKNCDLNEVKKYIYDIYKNSNKIELINKQFDKIIVKNSNSLIYKLVTNEK